MVSGIFDADQANKTVITPSGTKIKCDGANVLNVPINLYD